MKASRVIWGIVALVVLFSSCARIYHYRKKVKAGTQAVKYISFRLDNNSPAYISGHFENELTKQCLAKLGRLGFVESKKTKCDYDFILTLRVDSFAISKGKWLGPLALGIQREYYVMQITFDYNMLFAGTSYTFWKNSYAIYFFNYEYKDLRRAKALSRYSIGRIYK